MTSVEIKAQREEKGALYCQVKPPNSFSVSLPAEMNQEVFAASSGQCING